MLQLTRGKYKMSLEYYRVAEREMLEKYRDMLKVHRSQFEGAPTGYTRDHYFKKVHNYNPQDKESRSPY